MGGIRTVTLLSAMVLAGILMAAAVARAAELPFALGSAEQQQVAQERVYDATIEAVQKSTVSAQTSGRIIAINFDVDDYVTKGSVLLRFRDVEQRANLKSAEARYQEAAAEFKRTSEIYAKKLVAKSAYDRAQATLKTAQARLEQAREQLEHTVVRAPYSGIVTKRFVEIGETANVGQPLMTGLSLDNLRAVVAVPEAIIATVREHNQARIILPFKQNESLGADKITFFPYADPQSHTFRVRLQLPPGQKGLYPGMFVKAAFVVGEVPRLTVPKAAVTYRSEVTAVYVVDAQNRISFRQIRLGRELPDGRVEVLAGLSAGERVALDPVQAGVYLKEHEGSAS